MSPGAPLGEAGRTHVPGHEHPTPTAVGEADEPVAFATIVLAEIDAKPDSGSPVQLVSVPLVGVPRIGVTKVGLVARANPPVPVDVAPPSVLTIAETLASSRTVAAAAVLIEEYGLRVPPSYPAFQSALEQLPEDAKEILPRKKDGTFNAYGFYMSAQGSLIVYVIIIWYYARYMNRLDREYDVHEGEDE